MNYTKKAVLGTSIIFAFAILTAFFSYLFRLTLARNLTIEEYGLFYGVFSLISLLWIFKDLGLGNALAKYIPEFKIKKEYGLIKKSIVSALGFQLFFSGILAILLFIFSNFLALRFFHHPQAAIVIKIFAAYLILKPIVLVCSSSFQGFQNIKYLASIDLVRSLVVLILAYFGFKWMESVLIPTFAYIITTFVLTLIFVPVLVRKVFPQFSKSKFSIDKNLIKKLFKFGVPVMIGGASWFFMSNISTLLLTWFSGLEQVGLYNAALPTVNLLQYFSLSLATVLLPITSELWTKNHKKKISVGIKKLYKYSLFVIVPFSLIMFLFSDLLLKILFGVEYISASNALKILALGSLFFIIAKTNFSILAGIGKPKINAKIMWFTAVINIILNFILIPSWGIVGAALATVISFLIMLILSTIYLKKNIKIKIPLFIWFKIFLLGILFVVLVSSLKKMFSFTPLVEAVLIILIGLLAYILLSFIFKIISFKEIKGLHKNLTS